MYKKLEEIANITTGKLNANMQNPNGKYPFFTCASQPAKIDTYAFEENAILLAGNNANGTFHLSRYNGKFNAYQRTYVITSRGDFDIDYIAYSIRLYLEALKRQSQGTQTKFLTIKILNNIKIQSKTKELQIKTIQGLKNIDNKISINNSIISKLEEMAKTIYEYWFLQFDFPNQEGKPYASSGGAMKYSEELGRAIPTDWEVLNLWERFEFEKGIEIGAKQYLNESGKNRVLFWRVGDMNGTCSTYADEKLFGELLLQPRDICVSFDGSVGKVDFGLVGGYSSGIRNIYDRAKKIDSSVIYQIFKSNHIQQLIHKYATGSNILHASGSITNMRIPYNEKVFEEYQKIIKPMFDKMVQAKQENQKLTQLRDWLLPMLMNGQARVE